MSTCCENAGKDFPVIGLVCNEMERRYQKPCGEMDSEVPYIDYTTKPYTQKIRQKDGKTDVDEVLLWAIHYANNEYVGDFKAGRVVGLNGSFVSFLHKNGLLPPWIIRSNKVNTEVSKASFGKSVGEQFFDILKYFTSQVTYNPVPGDHVRYAEAIFDKEKTGGDTCLFWVSGLYGLYLPTEIGVSFTEIPDLQGNGIFDIGLVADVSGQQYFVDPIGTVSKGSAGSITPELSIMAYFFSELVATGERGFEWLRLADAIVPHDFHIALNISKWHEKHRNYGEAAMWIYEVRRRNPNYPLKIKE